MRGGARFVSLRASSRLHRQASWDDEALCGFIVFEPEHPWGVERDGRDKAGLKARRSVSC